MRWNYYKLRQLSLLQSAMDLLQIATGITKFDDYYKLRQYTCIQNFFRVSTLYRVGEGELQENFEKDALF